VPRAGVDRGQAPGGAAQPPLEGVVAARVENDDVDAILGLGHLLQQEIHVDRGNPGDRLGIDLGVDGHQIVVPADLQPVARVVEEPDAALGEPAPELDDRRLHRALVGVLVGEDGEAELAEGSGHRAHVVDRVAQRDLAVAAVADHQRDAGLLARRLGAGRGGHDEDRHDGSHQRAHQGSPRHATTSS